MPFLRQIETAMRELEDTVGSSFNDLDVVVREIAGKHEVTHITVSVHHMHNYEYGAMLPIQAAKTMSPSSVAAYFYGFGAAKYEEERVPYLVGGGADWEIRSAKGFEVVRDDGCIGHIVRTEDGDFDAYRQGSVVGYIGRFGHVHDAAEAIVRRR